MQDLWLLKLDASAATADRLARWRRGCPALRAWQGVDDPWMYLYLPGDLPAGDKPIAAGADWTRLTCVQSLDGASAGQPAPYHYIVETDVLPEHEEDLRAWYAEEHLPGLAAVPGTVRAARYVDVQGSPRYYACYDLTSPGTLGCPPWLAVRGTAWSSRVRPAFRNTRRTMFRQA